MGDAASAVTLVERVMSGGLVLHLVDSAADAHGRLRSRAYVIAVQPALWGGVDVVRSWGRRGHLRRPRLLASHHASDPELRRAVADVVSLRLRHGYVPAVSSG